MARHERNEAISEVEWEICRKMRDERMLLIKEKKADGGGFRLGSGFVSELRAKEMFDRGLLRWIDSRRFGMCLTPEGHALAKKERPS
jgi:hypothetical protein